MMAIKIQFEIGHTATVKSKRTPEGFTHDWELYVQGVNKSDISLFVEKVVFNLHESFPKPKRSFKEPPYVLKESGYAGFLLPIDVYFRNRDEPKKAQFMYDLDLQQEGPPLHRSELRKFIFEAPSDDFRQKLLKGGGVAVSGVVGGSIADEKSLDMTDNRSQLVGKPKLSGDSNNTSSSSKKHKQRADDSKLNTFANLFGTPITKNAQKFSPDPKAKTTNGSTGTPLSGSIVGNSKGGGGKDKGSSGGNAAAAGITGVGPATTIKEKDKADKKEKHKQTSPHKDKAHEEKEGKKKSDAKHDKRDEKKKEKKDKDKDRDRNKEKPSKRSLSPKSVAAAATAAPSPKRPSPVRPSSSASRDDPNTAGKSSNRTSDGDKRASTSSSGKKSKKDKKSHDKEREHKDRHRTESKDSIPVTTNANITPPVQPATAPNNTTQVPATAPVRTQNNATSASKNDLNNKTQKSAEKESKKSESTPKSTDKESTPTSNEKKSSTDKDKKSHKHKKKDKNKEKEKEKDKDQGSKKNANKEKRDKKEKPGKPEPIPNNNAVSTKKSTAAAAETNVDNQGETQKTATNTYTSKQAKQNNNNASAMPSNTSNTNTMGTSSASGLLNNDLSDGDSLNSESLHATSNSNSDKVTAIQNSDSSNCSFPDVPPSQQPPQNSKTLFQAPPNPTPTPPSSTSTPTTPSSSSHDPTRTATVSNDKKDHKTNRNAEKSKADKDDKKRRRNSIVVTNTFVEPPIKQAKKDFNTKTSREKSQSPLLRADEKQTFLPPPATTSTLSVQNSTPITPLNVEYLTELQELHHKIMTLQDNEELQQVVEMIAATGRYEITSKTFDFDLCKLDRHTVQRLQEFFATSVS